MRTSHWLVAVGLALVAVPLVAPAQEPTPARTRPAASALTRAQAIEAALARGPRRALVAADTLAASAMVRTARTFPNPTLTTEYTKDTPQYHLLVDLPLDLGARRSARVRAAATGRAASQLRFAADRAAIRYDADVAYTRAQAAAARAAIARRNAAAADSLRSIAVARRDAGDASELEVELASVNAGQQENTAVADEMESASATLDLGVLLGIGSDADPVVLADSLDSPPDTPPPEPAGTPLLVDAAAAALASAEASLRQQQRSTWLWPSLTAGFDTHDPGGARGLLPVVGLSLPLPLLDRNRGPILAATADRDRAAAALAIARLEFDAGIRRARRERDAATTRLSRDRLLLSSADRVAAMSMRAYQEGAIPLATVLEAQRAARDVLRDYIDDLAAARIAAATLALVTLTAGQAP